MLVSQYIYTACGKDRTGAFSVFSKSKDITEQESSEIREVMMYKVPPGLPYEPTEQQIEDLFPKKFGYFFLSSGRVCLAQVCYVGRVYSELDGRVGNYIIHAFVFNKTDTFSPYSFAENNVFKRILTRKEWHDDPIPDELPQIELPENGGMLSASEVTTFLNEERKIKLKLLIEAIINSSDENPVSFNDDHKNLKFWFKLLSVCLPKALQCNVSFCSYFTNTIMPGNISSRIQMKVGQPETGMFNYAQEAQKGRYVFDFARNIMPSTLKAGKYSESIVKLLSSGIFEAVKYVDIINKVMSTYSVNINEASDLLNINKADYTSFSNADDIVNTVILADRVGYETQTIASNLWTKKPQYNFNAQQKLSMNSFIYKNLVTESIRFEIIKMIFDKPDEFGINSDTAITFRDELHSKASYIFSNYHNYLKSIGISNYVTQNKTMFSKLYIAFDYFVNIPVVKNAFQARNYNASEELIAVKNIMLSAFERQSISDIDMLINSANSHISNSGVELLSIVIKDVIKTGVRITSIQFSFDLVQRLRNKTDFIFVYLLHLIKTNSTQEDFLKMYIKAQDTDTVFYAKFENDNKQEPILLDFCKKKEAYRFANQPLSLDSLKNYFEKHYITGADTGLFVKRLGDYLCAIQPDKRIKECMSILDKIKFPASCTQNLIPPVHYVIIESIFSVNYDKIFDFYGKQEFLNKINELYKSIKESGSSLKQETDELVVITLCGGILCKYDPQTKNQHLLNFFSNNSEDVKLLIENIRSINTLKCINTFIDFYFQPVVNLLIFGVTLDKQFKYESIVESVFGKFIEKGDLDKIVENFAYGVKISKAKPVVFILYIFRKLLMSSPRNFEKRLGEIAYKYFEKISAGERKKMFAELLSKADEKEIKQFEGFFEKFNKEHKTGFFNLFK